ATPTSTPTPTPVPTPTGPIPTIDFFADNTVLTRGSGTTLRWSTVDAVSCTGYYGLTGVQPTTGTFATGNLSGEKYYMLYCTGPGGKTAYKSVLIHVFDQVNVLQPNDWTLQQALDSGLSLNCASPFMNPGEKGPDWVEHYFFSDGKVRKQRESLASNGTFVMTYIDIFYPGTVVYNSYADEPATAYYPGSTYYDYFAAKMSTTTLTGYACNQETINSNLFVPVL
ncbi:MAG: hypothetical protein AAB420_04200, partial [Patescibacteria group bacterium]